jgi:glucose-1-phosphate thymidylyltransferase
MKGLILSGGKGTRLYPLTYTLAKQLIPVANKPVLVRVIEAIRDAGVGEIGVVIAPNTGQAIRDAIGDGSRWGVKLTYILQPSPDGLAHAVKISRDFIGDERFVMFLGDNVIQGGISQLISDFASSDWNSQIVLKEVENPSAFGVAKLRADGSIEQLVEKPQNPPSNLALVGIYMFDHHIFEAADSIQPSARGELEITDAIQWLITQGYSVFPHVHQGWWIDTGKMTDMLEANSLVLEELTPGVAPEAEIDANSQVDRRATIERGARIINSIVRGPTIIGENTLIENSYIGPFTSIYHHVTVKNCEIERSIILEHSTICNLQARLQDSLIGRHANVMHNDHKPRVLKMNLGDHSSLWTV